MELARSLLGIATVFALLGVLLWIGRRKGLILRASSRPGERRLELIERLSLTANHSVHLLRAGDRTLLVAVHNSGLTILCELSPPKPKET